MMPVISACIEPGCSTLCMGLFCIEHDARPEIEFPRGRPWPPAEVGLHASPAAVAAAEPVLTLVRPAA